MKTTAWFEKATPEMRLQYLDRSPAIVEHLIGSAARATRILATWLIAHMPDVHRWPSAAALLGYLEGDDYERYMKLAHAVYAMILRCLTEETSFIKQWITASQVLGVKRDMTVEELIAQTKMEDLAIALVCKSKRLEHAGTNIWMDIVLNAHLEAIRDELRRCVRRHNYKYEAYLSEGDVFNELATLTDYFDPQAPHGYCGVGCTLEQHLRRLVRRIARLRRPERPYKDYHVPSARSDTSDLDDEDEVDAKDWISEETRTRLNELICLTDERLPEDAIVHMAEQAEDFEATFDSSDVRFWLADGSAAPGDHAGRIRAYRQMLTGKFAVIVAKYKHGRLVSQRPMHRPAPGTLFAQDLGDQLYILGEAIGRLSTDNRRRYATLCLMQGLPYKKVARIMGVHPAAVSKQMDDVWTELSRNELARSSGLDAALARIALGGPSFGAA
jgi:hypothetical protein